MKHPDYNIVQNDISPNTTCFALLGIDFMIDEFGNIKVCQVNSHPALGWGTMSNVPSSVFRNLIEDTLLLLLKGDKDDELIEETNFDRI